MALVVPLALTYISFFRTLGVFALLFLLQDDVAGGLRPTLRSLVPKAQSAYIRLWKGWGLKETSAVTMVFEGSRQEAALQRREVGCLLMPDVSSFSTSRFVPSATSCRVKTCYKIFVILLPPLVFFNLGQRGLSVPLVCTHSPSFSCVLGARAWRVSDRNKT